MEPHRNQSANAAPRQEAGGQRCKLLYVDREDVAMNDGLRRLFNAREVQVISRTTSFLAALRSLDFEAIDVIVLGPKFQEEESSLFALSAQERGFAGLVLRVVPIPRHLKRSGPVTTPGSRQPTQANPKFSGPSYPVPLTSRQRIVFERVSDGWTTKRIAQSLRRSEGSVKGSIQQLFRKLGVRKRALIARIAAEGARANTHDARSLRQV